METVPINSLSPTESTPSDKAIRAVVTLLWPYSSSTKQCAFLLADPDFRLRNRKGQVRIRFTGASAEAVAKGKIGIGDEVVLGLHGAQWASESGNVSTPGKSVDGELVFRGDLELKVEKKASGEEPGAQIRVNETTPPPEQPGEQIRGQNGPVATPARASPAFFRSSLGYADVVPIYSSPAFVRRLRLSEEAEKHSWDPWADVEAELEGPALKKQRVSLSGVNRWRLAERTPSPEKEAPNADMDPGEDAARDGIQAAQTGQTTLAAATQTPPSQLAISPQTPPLPKIIDFGAATTTPSMPPPPLPRLQMSTQELAFEPEKATSTADGGPTTPKLQPVPSSALPLPSPFPTENDLPQFDQIGGNAAPANIDLTLASETQIAVPASGREAEAIERSGDVPIPSLRSRAGPALVIEESQQLHESYNGSLASTASRPNEDSQEEPRTDADDSYLHTQTQEEYMSDTEEDEEMYIEHLRRRFPSVDSLGRHRVDHQHEDYYNDMSDLDESEADEVIEDMGEPPSEDPEEDEAEAHDTEDSGDEAGDEKEDSRDSLQNTRAVEVIEIQETPQESLTTHPIAIQDQDVVEIQGTLRVAMPSVDTQNQSMVEIQETPRVSSTIPSSAIRDQSAAVEVIEIQETPQEPFGSSSEFTQDRSVPDEAGALQSAAENMTSFNDIVEGEGKQASSTVANTTAQRMQTPARPPAGLFGLDGAFETMSASRSAPKSEHDRIMSKTYSSLFGFKASTSPERQRAPQPQHQIQTSIPALPNFTSARALSPTVVDALEKEPVASIAQTAESAPVADIDDGSLLEAVLGDQASSKAAARERRTPIENPEAASKETEPETDDRLNEVDVIMGSEPPLQRPSLDADDPVPEGSTINRELGDAIAPMSLPAAQEVALSDAPRPSQQVEVIDLGSSDVEDEDERVASEHQALAQTNQTAFDLDIPSGHNVPAPPPLHEPMLDYGQLNPPYSAMTQDSLGSGLQSDMLDTTQTTVDRSEVQTPVAQVEDYTMPETVHDEPLPWVGPGQRSFSTDRLHSPDAQAVQLPLTQQTTAVIIDNEYPSFQSATSIATDNSNNIPSPAAQSFAQEEEDQQGVATSRLSPPATQFRDGEPAAESFSPALIRSAALPVQSQPQAPLIDLSSSPAADEQAAVDVAADDSNDVVMENHESDASRETVIPAAPLDGISSHDNNDMGEDADGSSATRSFSQFAQPPQVFVSSQTEEVVEEDGFSAGNDDSAEQSEDFRSEVEDEQLDVNEQLHSQLLETDSAHPSSPRLLPSPEESQHCLESQPFETQVPVRTELPQTPQLTQGDFLLNLMDVDAEVDETPVREPATTRRTRSQSVASEASLQVEKQKPIRRSPRKLQLEQQILEEADEAESVAESVTTDQRDQRTSPRRIRQRKERQLKETFEAEAEAEAMNVDQPTSPRRTRQSKEPESLLSPQRKTPIRRSPRKSQADSQILELDEHSKPVKVESAHERATPEPKDRSRLLSPAKKTPVRRSPRKSQVEIHAEELIDEDGGIAVSTPERTSTHKQTHEKVAAQESQTEVDEERPIEQAKKTPARRSFAARFGGVPDAISNWFSPRRATREEPAANESATEAELTEKNEASATTTPSAGFATKMAYYSPLSNISEKLNPSSQTYGDNTVDILAVVSDDTTEPKRAKTGPRDYSTIFRITDTSVSAEESVRVEVFRPWTAVLPVAKAGDIILLRSFAVKSKNRQAYLLSSDSSAWCVWRYSESPGPADDSTKPVWAQKSRRTRATSFSGIKESVLGPPVELGDEERQRAEELRVWWLGSGGRSTGDLDGKGE